MHASLLQANLFPDSQAQASGGGHNEEPPPPYESVVMSEAVSLMRKFIDGLWHLI